MKRYQSKNTDLQIRISLPFFDDKRFFLDDGIHTLAYFYKEIDSNR